MEFSTPTQSRFTAGSVFGFGSGSGSFSGVGHREKNNYVLFNSSRPIHVHIVVYVHVAIVMYM